MSNTAGRSIEEPARSIPVSAEYDVLVVGGGPSGLTAALAAAEDGLRVGLIESRSFVGGNMTIGLPVLGFLGQKGNQIIDGLPQKFIDRLRKRARRRQRASALPAAHGHHARRAGSREDGRAGDADRGRRRCALLHLLCRRA